MGESDDERIEDVNRSPMVDRKTVQEVVRHWVCEKYVYNDKDFGCDGECSRDCPAKDAPLPPQRDSEAEG